MDETALKELWKSNNQKVEENLILNKKNTMDITRIKVQTLLSSMKPVKIFTIVVGIAWVLIVDSILINIFIYAYDKVSLFFVYSAVIQVVITKMAIGVYIYHLILLNNINVTEPIVTTQENLASLKTSTLLITRVLFLQLPVWTTFYISDKMFVNADPLLLIMQCMITITFTYLALWLFVNIRYENRHKKWFKVIFSGNEWTPLLKSMELLSQVSDYKQNTAS